MPASAARQLAVFLFVFETLTILFCKNDCSHRTFIIKINYTICINLQIRRKKILEMTNYVIISNICQVQSSTRTDKSSKLHQKIKKRDLFVVCKLLNRLNIDSTRLLRF